MATTGYIIDEDGLNLIIEGSLSNLTVDADGIIGVADGNPQIVFDNANNWLEITGSIGITGGFKANSVTKTGAYTTTAADYTILCDASSGSFTITLIALASYLEGIYHIKKIDSSANTVTLDGNGAETIDGAATAVLTVQYESITIQAGSEWSIL